jgi:hypothetical protein
MRYKIQARDRGSYESLKNELQTRVQIKVDLPRRFMLSVDGLSDNDKQLIRNYGATFSEAIKFKMG